MAMAGGTPGGVSGCAQATESLASNKASNVNTVLTTTLMAVVRPPSVGSSHPVTITKPLFVWEDCHLNGANLSPQMYVRSAPESPGETVSRLPFGRDYD
jgi:hypothetical protein